MSNAYRLRRNDNAYGNPQGLTDTLSTVRGILERQGGKHRLKVGTADWGPWRGRILTLARLALVLPRRDEGETVRIQTNDGNGTRIAIRVAPDEIPGTTQTPYGYIYPPVGPCRDDYPNIVRFRSLAGDTVMLQEAAANSFKAVENDAGSFRITGSHRTCEFQRAKYAEDPNRFAPPDKTLHTRGLAIDVHTGDLSPRLVTSLIAHGWKRVRPDDEPWHVSYVVAG